MKINISITNVSDSDDDRNNWYYTIYKNLDSGKSVKNGKHYWDGTAGINEKQLADLLDVPKLDLQIRCDIYKQNKNLFFNICDMNSEICDMVLQQCQGRKLEELLLLKKSAMLAWDSYEKAYKEIYGKRTPSRYLT